ncbi:MAG: hypothetical protein ABJH63_19960 [Rhizobiaceae bacterium]
MSDSTNAGTPSTRVGGLGGLLDIMFEQSLVVRAERSKRDGEPHPVHWSTPIARFGLQVVTAPFQNPVPAALMLLALLFSPLF